MKCIVAMIISLVVGCSDNYAIKWEKVTVHSGDTVWDLISEHNRNSNMNMLRYAYKEHGGNMIIHAGKVIEIPVKVEL